MSSPQPTQVPFVGTGGIASGGKNGQSQQWHNFTLVGILSPGTIPKGGIRGFKRKTGWDKQAGKGTQGATLILKTKPPVEGTITLQLITTQDFRDLDYFVANALAIDPVKQKAEGLEVYYPGFSCIALTRVVVAHYGIPEHVGKGKYEFEIELIEWQKPPPVSIVQTPNTTAPNKQDPDSTVPVDPRIQAGQDDVAEALAEQAATP